MTARQIPRVEAPEARERPGRGAECVFELPPFPSPPLEMRRRVPLVTVDTQMVRAKRVNGDQEDVREPLELILSENPELR